METFIDRLNIEKNDLNDKIGKLKTFMESDKFNSIDVLQRSLLQIQIQAMFTYSQVLFERIKWLEMPTDDAG